MKKLLTIAAIAGAASLSYGQGFVNFTGAGSTFYTNSVASSTGGSGTNAVGAKNSVTAYYFALFVAPSTTAAPGTPVLGDPTTAGWTFTGDYATNGTAKGGFTGFGENGGDVNSVGVSGYAPGSTADFLIVGWSGNVGTSWASAQAVIAGNASGVNGSQYSLGESLVGDAILAPAGGPYNAVLGTAAGQIGSFALGTYLIPEPTTCALCGLGAAALVVFRRRK